MGFESDIQMAIDDAEGLGVGKVVTATVHELSEARADIGTTGRAQGAARGAASDWLLEPVTEVIEVRGESRIRVVTHTAFGEPGVTVDPGDLLVGDGGSSYDVLTVSQPEGSHTMLQLERTEAG